MKVRGRPRGKSKAKAEAKAKAKAKAKVKAKAGVYFRASGSKTATTIATTGSPLLLLRTRLGNSLKRLEHNCHRLNRVTRSANVSLANHASTDFSAVRSRLDRLTQEDLLSPNS